MTEQRPSDEPHPWEIVESELDLERLAQRESCFALSNGHIGLRGTLDEGEPHGLPGTYLNGVYETRPLPYAEAGYGFPEDGQTVVNVTNGKLIRLLVDDEPFDIRYGQLLSHRRVLDMRAGTLERDGLKGKPAPDTFLAGARALDSAPAHAVVFEDALAGVEAGRAGNFGFVVGVDRVGHADELREHGADVVVSDLAELLE